VICERS